MPNAISRIVASRLISCMTMFSREGAEGERCGRERWAILYKYEGETVYFCGGKTYLSNREHPIILPRGSSYSWRSTAAGHFLSMEFEAEGELDALLSFSLQSPEDFLALIKAAEAHRLSLRESRELVGLSDLYALLVKLSEAEERRYRPSRAARLLAPAVEKMQTEFAARPSNDELAALCSLSTVYFRRLFREVYGISPGQYRSRVRIARAEEMLLGDYGSIGEVAELLGYPSIYEFSREFCRKVGCPPSVYAKKENLRGKA